MKLSDLLIAKIRSVKRTIRNNQIWFFALLIFGSLSFIYFAINKIYANEDGIFEFGLSIITVVSGIIQKLNSGKKRMELSKLQFSVDKIDNLDNLSGLEKTIVEQVAQSLIIQTQ